MEIQEEKIGIWDSIGFQIFTPFLFGKGKIRELSKIIGEISLNAKETKETKEKLNVLIVIGSSSLKDSGKLDEIQDSLNYENISSQIYETGPNEATTDEVDNGVALIKKNEFPLDCIVGIGGGSVLDIAKSIAGILTNGGKATEYHQGKQFTKPGIPIIAVPTTAGTGSEASNNAVLTNIENDFKKSIRGDALMAKYIILDPELTLNCPKTITARSGADALVQAIEAYTSKTSHKMSDIYALHAISLISKNLYNAYHKPDDYDARAQMLLGAYFAGVAFSNVKLGLVHALAHPLGHKFKIPHGTICGLLLPYVIEYNISVREKKYAKIAQVIHKKNEKNAGEANLFHKVDEDGNTEEKSKKLIGMIKELLISINIPLHLAEFGVQEEDFEWIIDNCKGGSYAANPRVPDHDSLMELLQNAL